jgi:eukaryotic-like serine/threonine-protein kinase
MRDDLQRRAFALFEAYLDWPEDERASRLDAACANDDALLQAVMRLARANDAGKQLMPTEVSAAGSAKASLPAQIGVYRIAGLIGAGGMGAVVRGERNDGVFDQTVAIKLIRPGLLSETAIKQFTDERRILARLKHPHIGQIIDGGVTDAGAPYLVMEYLDGVSLSQAVSDGQMTLRQRLDLFLQTCDAVTFAHRNLVVHADIKPSNIIVTADAGVKLLDFGIARLMDRSGSVEAAAAEPMTLAYAAPERRAGGPPSIAGDVYALGVVLYELLTGGLPERVTMTETRVLGADDPIQVRALDWTAPSRAIEPNHAKLVPAKAVAGDIDAIVLKALRANPANRYDDVQGLRDDILLHLADRPVSAMAGGWRYASGKFVRRHRLGLALTAATITALSIATAVSFWQFRQAEVARGQAEQRFGEVRSLAKFMLFDVYDALLKVPGSAESRLLIANASRSYLDGLRKVEGAPVDVTMDAGVGYLRLAQVQGVRGASSLGDSRAAHDSLDVATSLLQVALKAEPQNAAILAELGWVYASRWAISASPVYKGVKLSDVSQRHFEAALEIDPTSERAKLGLIAVSKNRSYDLNWDNKNAEALAVARSTLKQLGEAKFTGRNAFEAFILESSLRTIEGDALYYMDRPLEALVPYREGRRLLEAGRKIWGDSPQLLNALAMTYWNIGGTYSDMPTMMQQSLVEMDTGLAIVERILSFGPDINAQRMRDILLGQKAANLQVMGRSAEAAPVAELVLKLREQRRTNQPHEETARRDVAVQALMTAKIMLKIGNRQRACELARMTQGIWKELEAEGLLFAKDRKGDVPANEAMLSQAC